LRTLLKWLKRIGFGLLMFLVTFIPVWLFILGKVFFNPEGFWQEIVFYGAGIYVLGGIQFFMLIGGAFFTLWAYATWDCWD